MDKKEILNNMAVLETKIDILESELSYLHNLLVRCGFPNGIHTLKKTAEELLHLPSSETREGEWDL